VLLRIDLIFPALLLLPGLAEVTELTVKPVFATLRVQKGARLAPAATVALGAH